MLVTDEAVSLNDITPPQSGATQAKSYDRRPLLNKADVEWLLNESSDQVRAEVAQKVAQDFNSKNYNSEESIIASDIFRALSKDKSILVRRTISEELKDNLELPHDIALALAGDEETEVAVPILEYSYVLTEDDLIALVMQTTETMKLYAVARRQSISKDLSHSLIDKRNAHVSQMLLRNGGAMIHDEDMEASFEQFGTDVEVLEALVHRGGLSLALVEKLFKQVPSQFKHVLSRKYRLPYYPVDGQEEEQALSEMTIDLDRLVNELHRKHKLTYITAIRSLCRGDLKFFERILAKMAKIPVDNARLLIMDRGTLGFYSLYKTCDMPRAMYGAMKVLLDIVLEETDFGRLRRSNIRQRIVERIMGEGYDQRIDHMSYLMSIIGKDVRHPYAFH